MTGWSRRQVLQRGVVIGIASGAGCGGASESDAANESRTVRSETDAPSAGANANRTARAAENRGEPTTETSASGRLPETAFRAERFVVETVATDLTVPWDLAFSPDGDLYFTERPGRIGVLESPGQARTLATARDTNGGREGGLLGITLSPTFPEPPAVYVYQTYLARGERFNRIVEYHRSAAGLRRRGVVLDEIPGDLRHNGGRIAFGPDGKLYATTGDTTNGDLAQDRSSLAGKVLRIEPDGSVPRDNPFGSPVWSYGHRNPQGLAWNPRTGRCIITEHGPVGNDEVNEIEPGRNYGWPAVSGQSGSRFTGPLLDSGGDSWAPCGAAVYTGERFPAWRGNLLFTTLGYSTGDGRRSLHSVSLGGDGNNGDEGSEGGAGTDHRVLLEGRFGRLRAVETAPDGSIYFTNSNRDGRGDPAPIDDRIFRLRPIA